MRSVLAVLAALLAGGPALANLEPSQRLGDPALEARAQAIGRELRCMVCQNQSIEDSESEIARDLRRMVREEVVAGRADAEVTRRVHDRYGDFVLLRPPLKASTLLLWGAPFLVLGAAGVTLMVRQRGRASVPLAAEGGELSAAEQARLARIENDARHA